MAKSRRVELLHTILTEANQPLSVDDIQEQFRKRNQYLTAGQIEHVLRSMRKSIRHGTDDDKIRKFRLATEAELAELPRRLKASAAGHHKGSSQPGPRVSD